MPHICKMEKLEIRAVIKCTLFKKALSPKEIHEDFMESLVKESSYSTVTKWAAEFKGERALTMMGGLAAPKMPPLMKLSRSCTPWLCVIGVETCEA